MKAILSTTHDPLYLFFAPLAAYSWQQVGYEPIVLMPKRHYNMETPVEMQVIGVLNALSVPVYRFNCLPHEEATYAQVSRLFGWIFGEDQDETVITGDIDMMVFDTDKHRWADFDNGIINIFGSDLTPEKQYPICYCAAPKKAWRDMFGRHVYYRDNKEKTLTYSLKHALSDLISIPDDFRGNFWCRDQEMLYNAVEKTNLYQVRRIKRAISPTQPWASYRADRDGWGQWPLHDVIDAHLPRPGYTPEAFTKITELMMIKYGTSSFIELMQHYRDIFSMNIKIPQQ